jgi:Zn finger protein HypA/HybF involved in hydrogenase expression
MHEMGIASSIMNAARSEAARFPGAIPARIGVRIGEWAGVDTESLRFCFESLVLGTDLAGLQLDIDYRGHTGDLDIAFVELED